MSRPIHARVATWAMLLGLSAACRPGEGDLCRCQGDCRRGLVCAVEGRVLPPGECVHPTGTQPLGECIASSDVPEDPDDLDDPPLYFDLGTRRDLDPGQPVGDDTGATTTGTGDTGSTTTDATTDTSTGTTASTDETDTGTGTTVGTTETSTDTGR
jgi:hypothetical protein